MQSLDLSIEPTEPVWWKKNIHDGLENAKLILKRNQYPPNFFEPIIRDILTQIVSPEMIVEKTEEDDKL